MPQGDPVMDMVSVSVAVPAEIPTWWDRRRHKLVNFLHCMFDKVPPKFERCEICTEETSYRIGTDKTKYPFRVRKGPLVCECCFDTIFNPYTKI